MKKQLKDFVDAHLNKRIFIFGTGPTLNEITTGQIKKIEESEIIRLTHL